MADLKQRLTFAEWWDENGDEIVQAQEFSKDALSDAPGELAAQLSRAQSEYARMGALLADAESFLIQARAAAVLDVIKDPKYEDLAATERKHIVEDKAKDVKRLRDNLEVTVVALKQKCFAIMNTRNFMAGERPLSTEN